MTDYITTDTDLTSVANAIRTKGGTSAALEWPSGFSSAIAAIPSSGGITPTGTISIDANGTYDVTNYASADVSVSGGSSKNVQVAQSTTRSTSSTYTEVISLTCDVAGTYDVYWSTYRSSTSGSWGSQLYRGNSAYGSAQTSGWSNHIQNIHLTGVIILEDQTVSVRVSTRGSNYYGYVGTLTIIQTA